jgi:membrane fusion protein (multidrug efflux system)
MNKIIRANIFLLPAFFFFASCGKKPEADNQKKNEVPAIEGFVVKPQQIQDKLEVSGTLLPEEETVLMPEVSGQVVLLYIPEGAHVERGTLLVKLSEGDLSARRAKLESQLKLAEATAARQKDLVALNGISQLEYEQTLAEVAGYKADLDAVDADIAKTYIRAPYSGIIGLKKISEGAFVSPGTPLTTIRSDKELKIDFSVPESYASQIDKQTSVEFMVDGDSTKYSATVLATEQSIETGSRNLQVRARVNSTDKKLVPGASATVKLGFALHANALLVPSEAVIPQARYKNIIVSKNGKAEFAKVQTGIRTPSSVEIISGLKAGDTIVTTGIQFIRPGSTLKFSSVK